ncbi:MAG: DUF2993 domain-containing protein [Prochloraceae cyanobacterium]
MEVLVIVISSLIAGVSPGGLVIDSVLENTLRSQIEAVEVLEIRVDNAPSYRGLQGKAERIRLATRGLQLIADLRIDTLELETDPIYVDVKRLRQGKQKVLNESFREPVQGGVRLVLTEKDINQALESQAIQARLQQLLNRLVSRNNSSQGNFQLLNPRLNLLDNNRLRFQMQLSRSSSEGNKSEPLDIMLELGVKLIAGRNIELIEPQATINGRKLSPRLLKGFARRINQSLDLRTLEEMGITAWVLKLNIGEDELNLATFIRYEALKSDRAAQEE